jgi:hypothetical protein
VVGGHPQLVYTSIWSHLSFNYFYAWNQFQREIILKNITHRKISIEILGPMLFVINKYNKILTKNFISVFDITPARFAKKLFYSKDIINGKYISKFHKDILQISIETKLPLVIRTKKGVTYQQRKCRHGVFFEDNEVVLLSGAGTNQGNLVGSRISGPITRESRTKNHRKVISQSKKIL